MMWIAIVVSYFVGACVLAALLLLPAFREKASRHLVQWSRHLAGARRSAGHVATQNARHSAALATGGARLLRRHLLPLTLAFVLLSLPPWVVFSLRALHRLDGYDDTTTPSRSEGVIAALLQGEQLVPPPPLPPEVFATAEVELIRPRLGAADRRWEALDADFRQRLLLAYRLMREEHGYEMVLIEGYRSPARQDLLANLGAHVTHAFAWQSYHQHGLAADSAFLRDGKLVISERDPWAARGYELYGEVAQRVGLTWGGRWQNADLGHVELRKPMPPHPKVGV